MTRSRILTVQGELNAEAAKLGLRVFSYAAGYVNGRLTAIRDRAVTDARVAREARV